MEPTPINTTTGENKPILNAPTEVIIDPTKARIVPSVVPVDDTLHKEEVAMGATGVNPTQANGVNPTHANVANPTQANPDSEVGQANVIEGEIISQLQANTTN